MSAQRSRREELAYKAFMKHVPKDRCVFCNPIKEEVIEDSKLFKVIRNIFGYSIWDGQKVVDHLMITPKKHVDAIAHFTDEMVAEAHLIMSKYELDGYNIYARSPGSAVKSVVHQHTHLIKTEGSSKKIIIVNRKPYFRFTS